MKTTMCKMKNILYEIYSKLVQEKRVNLKPNQYKSKLKEIKTGKKSVSYETTSGG